MLLCVSVCVFTQGSVYYCVCASMCVHLCVFGLTIQKHLTIFYNSSRVNVNKCNATQHNTIWTCPTDKHHHRKILICLTHTKGDCSAGTGHNSWRCNLDLRSPDGIHSGIAILSTVTCVTLKRMGMCVYLLHVCVHACLCAYMHACVCVWHWELCLVMPACLKPRPSGALSHSTFIWLFQINAQKYRRMTFYRQGHTTAALSPSAGTERDALW